MNWLNRGMRSSTPGRGPTAKSWIFAHFPAEPFQDDADLIFRGVLPTGRGSDLPDESPGLLSLGLCGLALIDVVLRHFWLLYRCSRFAPCTRSPNTPPSSGFSPLRSVPLSLNAYSPVRFELGILSTPCMVKSWHRSGSGPDDGGNSRWLQI